MITPGQICVIVNSLVTYTAVNPTVQYMTKSISESLNGA